MHEHDQEIIMALAEGILDEATAAAASAEIATCDECSADLELQRFALSALDDVPDVYLTATESATLHSSLRRELSIASPPPAREKRSIAWGRWLPAVGIAAVFIAAVAALPAMLGGSDDDSADMTVAATETTAASAEMFEATEAPAAAAAPQDRFSDDATDGGEGGQFAGADLEEAATDTTEAAATTTAAAETTTTISEGPDLVGLLDYLGPVAGLKTASLLEQIGTNRDRLAEVSAAALSLDPVFAMCLVETASPLIAPELGIVIDSAPLILGIVSTSGGEELALVAYVPEDTNETVFVTHQLFSCDVVEVVP